MVFCFFLNGNISFNLNVPPVGKLLNPFHGAWSPLQESRHIEIEGESGTVEILIDKRGVPHIYAETVNDALIGQGYIEARDRTFQMQFLRQAATGQLSEYFGERTISFDKWMHKKGLPDAVMTAKKVMSQDKQVAVTYGAYIKGANQYIDNLSYEDFPLEMKLLNLRPKSWDLHAAASVFKYMGNVLAGGNDDIENTNLRILLGDDQYFKYYREDEDDETPIVPLEVEYEFENTTNKNIKPDVRFEKPIYNAFYEKRNKNIGSNNWTLAGSKTQSGSPILCSDPHLSLSIPSIWYELNIITPEHNIYGVSFPGLPGIMIGFNSHIAWGETNVGHDVQDLYHIKWVDDNRMEYWLDGIKTPVKYRYDTIRVKGKPIVIDTNIITKWGPIIKKSNDGLTDIAMDWLVAKEAPASEGNTFIRAMLCKDYECFLEETSTFITPAQNFLYADKNNNIGLRVNGLLPARVENDGRFVSEGDSARYGWNHWIPRSQNPQSHNPKQGYLTSSNQRSTDKSYPYYYTGNFEKYRNRAINQHLDTVQNVTLEQMKVFQNNNYSKKAEDIVPLFLDAIDTASLSDQKYQVLEQIRGWNYEYHRDSLSPSIFEKWYDEVVALTWDEIALYGDTMAVKYPPSTVLRDLIRSEPDDKMFDRLHTIKKETAADIIKMGFENTVTYTQKLDNEMLKWGNENKVSIPHVARVPGLGVQHVFAGGCGDVINATRGSFGPSWRMVIGLGEEIIGYGIYPGGQSGDPRSEFYLNMLDKWTNGKYDQLLYNIDKSEIVN